MQSQAALVTRHSASNSPFISSAEDACAGDGPSPPAGTRRLKRSSMEISRSVACQHSAQTSAHRPPAPGGSVERRSCSSGGGQQCWLRLLHAISGACSCPGRVERHVMPGSHVKLAGMPELRRPFSKSTNAPRQAVGKSCGVSQARRRLETAHALASFHDCRKGQGRTGSRALEVQGNGVPHLPALCSWVSIVRHRRLSAKSLSSSCVAAGGKATIKQGLAQIESIIKRTVQRQRCALSPSMDAPHAPDLQQYMKSLN